MTIIESLKARFGLSGEEAVQLCMAIVMAHLDAFDNNYIVIVLNPLTKKKVRGIDIEAAAARIKAQREQQAEQAQPQPEPALSP